MCCDIRQADETCAHLVSSMLIRPIKISAVYWETSTLRRLISSGE